MKRHDLALASLLVVASAAACGGHSDPLIGEADPKPGDSSLSAGSGTPATDDGNTINQLKDKDFYKSNVFPLMAQKCGSCHSAAGPGPAWITPTDAEKSYEQLFEMGYVVDGSRVALQVAHAGETDNYLAPSEKATYNQWVARELADGGSRATPSVLARLGACFDRTKFDDMDLGNWRTSRRTQTNNMYNVPVWNENANQCTGCNAATCTTCHSSDPATNFKNAVGNAVLPVSSTFDDTKSVSPPYITKYFGISPDGKPVASGAIKRKSEATKRDRAYSHPMFDLTPEQWSAIDTFVNDALSKYNAGTCGK